MSKTLKLITAIIIFLIILVGIKFFQPSLEEKERHQALLCFVIRQNNVNTQDAEAIFDKVHFYQEASIASYVIDKPKFQEKYTRALVNHYLELMPTQKKQAQINDSTCTAFFKDI